MAIAISLLLLAWSAAGWLAYGLDPAVAEHVGGLALITLTRRIQWLLLVAAIVPSLILVARVALNKNRAVWLIGLSLVVALMFVRFSPESRRPVRVIDDGPKLPTLTDVPPGPDDEYVVGLVFEDVPYAFPYRGLNRTPIVQLTDFDQRLLLIFSPYANSATALRVSREVRATDIEFVATPDNSTLLYNRKYGQFIVGVTGKTDRGEAPVNVLATLDVSRVPLSEWRRRYPNSRWMAPTDADRVFSGAGRSPRFTAPPAADATPPGQIVALVHSDPPAALIPSEHTWPLNTRCGETPAALWIDDAGALRAFQRAIDGDLFLTFKTVTDAKKTKRIDEQTNSVWSTDGLAIDGPLKGKRLQPIRVEENVYWGVSKKWWPGLQMIVNPARPNHLG